MDEKKTPNTVDEELLTWFSTYGLITVERTLSLIGFRLTHDELMKAIHDENNIYHAFLEVPFKNILNGIILNQAQDYREYAQRLFVGFLLSGAGNAPAADAPPIEAGSAKDLLEKERLNLIEIGEQYDLEQFEHHKLISQSQKALIDMAADIKNKILTEEHRLKVFEKMAPYRERAEKNTTNLRQYRVQFYELIIRARDLIETIPDYFPDEQKMTELRSLLHFNTKIGES